MYELNQGSARLVYALERCKDDPKAIMYMAHALNYYPEQLRQDIQALLDLIQEAVGTSELVIAKKCMEQYLNFANNPSLPLARRSYFEGAAASINDFLCRIGKGNAVARLAEQQWREKE